MNNETKTYGSGEQPAPTTKRPALPRRFPEKPNPDIRQSEGFPGKLLPRNRR